MFLFKKIVAQFFMPVALCLEILVLGLVFLWSTRRQRLGKTLVTLGTALLALFGYQATTDWMLRPLEEKYPPSKRVMATAETGTAQS